MNSPTSTKYLINSLDRGLAALLRFIEQPEMSFSEFMQECSLNKAAAKRILYTLEFNNLIKYNPVRKTYELDIRVFELGTVAGENLALLKVARSYMESICNQINETVILAQKEDQEQIYLHKIEGVGTVHLKTLIGYRRPLHYGLGKTIMAYLNDAELHNHLPPVIPTYSMKTITDRDRFLEDINNVRAAGYAVDNEEFIDGVTGIGCPIFVNKSRIFGLIGVVAPTPRMSCEKKELVIGLLARASKAISLKLDEYIYNN